MRERIYKAAIELLCERDFDAVTVETITEAADVGKGTFFNYFASKEAVIADYYAETGTLLEEALLNPGTELQDRIDPEAYGHGVKPGPIWKRFVGTTYLAAERDGRNRKLARTLLSLSISNDAVRQASLAVRDKVIATIIAFVEEGQRTGEFRPDYPASEIGNFLRNLYYSTQLVWVQSDGPSPFEDHLSANIVLAWYAVQSPK